MKAKKLKALVQKRINTKVASSSKHFSSEIMDTQITALIEVIASMIDPPEVDSPETRKMYIKSLVAEKGE